MIENTNHGSLHDSICGIRSADYLVNRSLIVRPVDIELLTIIPKIRTQRKLIFFYIYLPHAITNTPKLGQGGQPEPGIKGLTYRCSICCCSTLCTCCNFSELGMITRRRRKLNLPSFNLYVSRIEANTLSTLKFFLSSNL